MKQNVISKALKVAAICSGLLLIGYAVIISHSVSDTIGEIRRGVKSGDPFVETYKQTESAQSDIGKMQNKLVVGTLILISASFLPWKK